MKYIKRIITLSIIVILVFLAFIGQSYVYDSICKNRVYKDLEQGISDELLSANVHIVVCKSQDNGISYSPGFGGVIFKQADDRYYILTAYHTVNDLDNAMVRIMKNGDLNYNEYNSKSENHVPLEAYYESFPIASLEYYDEKYDLAILSFHSETNFTLVNIASGSTKHNERIISMSQPTDEKDPIVTYGKITSDTIKVVTFNDRSQTENLFKHSAYVASGSSGSGVFNENYELIGINLGGGADLFHNFRYGYAIPSEKINEFIDQWGK